MSAIPKPIEHPRPRAELHNGDRMTREEFHRIYEQMPEDFRAELIGGIVYVSSPLGRRHGIAHPALTTVLFAYKGNTPGVEVGDNTTVLLDPDGEPQPDLYLRILPEFGGQSRTSEDDYVLGPPEMLIEIAHSSRSIDLHLKRREYARHGVLEYLVLSLADKQLRWFDLKADRELSADSDGVLRIRTFPGLWISGPAVLAQDYKGLMDVLNRGLATPEHGAFVQRLADARDSHPS